jgi:transcriptional regulator with GAF, ATPase, and Fis domain
VPEVGTLFLGRSPAIRDVLVDAQAIAASDAKVLISGESGVGKEVMARMIHAHSRRRQRPMNTINCAGVPEGLLETEFFGHVRGSFTGADRDHKGFLEQADTGTVLLDEVGEMSLPRERRDSAHRFGARAHHHRRAHHRRDQS